MSEALNCGLIDCGVHKLFVDMFGLISYLKAYYQSSKAVSLVHHLHMLSGLGTGKDKSQKVKLPFQQQLKSRYCCF